MELLKGTNANNLGSDISKCEIWNLDNRFVE